MKNHIFPIWFLLVLVTVTSFALAEQSTLPWISALIMTLTMFKGYLIIDGFMELYGCRRILRYAMNLYCPTVGVLIWLLVT